jgi:hypothetical protein
MAGRALGTRNIRGQESKPSVHGICVCSSHKGARVDIADIKCKVTNKNAGAISVLFTYNRARPGSQTSIHPLLIWRDSHIVAVKLFLHTSPSYKTIQTVEC